MKFLLALILCIAITASFAKPMIPVEFDDRTERCDQVIRGHKSGVGYCAQFQFACEDEKNTYALGSCKKKDVKCEINDDGTIGATSCVLSDCYYKDLKDADDVFLV